MLERDSKFLEEAFKQYYFDHFELIHVPDRTPEREFGYKKFKSCSSIYDLFFPN